NYINKTSHKNLWAVRGGGSRISLPKTGQETSYYEGDDGDLEKGISWPENDVDDQ
ncbi:hypothetical protein MCHI_000059, partial [Candidatus Magnetoovum chiemensis]